MKRARSSTEPWSQKNFGALRALLRKRNPETPIGHDVKARDHLITISANQIDALRREISRLRADNHKLDTRLQKARREIQKLRMERSNKYT